MYCLGPSVQARGAWLPYGDPVGSVGPRPTEGGLGRVVAS